jgi:hypothetical protein
MKAASQRQLVTLASRTLQIVGLVLIVSTLLDYIVLLLPPDFGNRAWTMNVVTQMVDRGIVPLVGLALLLTSGWVDEIGDRSERRAKSAGSIRLAAFALSSLLALIFLLSIPLHVNNVRLEQADALTKVGEEAKKALANPESVIGPQLAQSRAQVEALLRDPKLLNDAIAAKRVSTEQVAQLQKFKDNPASLDQFFAEQAKAGVEQLKSRVQVDKLKLEGDVQQKAMKSGLRTGLSSLLLFAGYALIGWNGLRGIR